MTALLVPIPSGEYDVERATRTWTPLQGSRNGHALETEEADVLYIYRRDDLVLIDNRLQITDSSLNGQSLPAMPTATASTSHISNSKPYRTIS